jgi:hypothetical protein
MFRQVKLLTQLRKPHHPVRLSACPEMFSNAVSSPRREGIGKNLSWRKSREKPVSIQLIW